MAKTINITNIDIKEYSISVTSGKINISFVYSLIADDGKEYDIKRGQFTDADLTTQQKNYINNISTALIVKIKQMENI